MASYTLSPWKSLIIKGIKNTDRRLWDYALSKHRINIRHAANELNCQVEDGTKDGLIIKRHIIRHFDKEDVHTYGLIFAVETLAASNMFGSVIIKLRQNRRSTRSKSLERFDIPHTEDFNPNSKELVVYRENVEKDFIGTYLVSLCKYFYERGSGLNSMEDLAALAKPSSPFVEKVSFIYQCKDAGLFMMKLLERLKMAFRPEHPLMLYLLIKAVHCVALRKRTCLK